MGWAVTTEVGEFRRAVDKLTKTGNYSASVAYLAPASLRSYPAKRRCLATIFPGSLTLKSRQFRFRHR